jgi:hypothetical protein
MLCPWDQFLQLTEHLAAIAHPQGKGVAPLKKRLKLSPKRSGEQHRLGPSTSRAQHVPIGKASARHQSLEIRQALGPCLQVVHVHIDRLKARTIECSGHLYLTVYALLTKDRDARASPIEGR